MIVSERNSDSQFEQVVSVLLETETKPLAINLTYRSPNPSAENNEQLNKFIRTLKSSAVTIGDINYPGIDWDNGCSDCYGRKFFVVCQDAFLQQHVDFPTHGGNTIDLILSTNDIHVQSVEEVGKI